MDFKRRNGARVCPYCGHVLKRNGRTKSGTQEWYCKHCHRTLNPNKKLQIELRNKSFVNFYIKYLLGTTPLEVLGCNRMKFNRISKLITAVQINPLLDCWTYSKVIYLDAIYFADKCCMIARNNSVVIGWKFCDSETAHNWFEFIRCFPMPEYVVCDGGGGLISAIHNAWPKTKHQRCLFHVWMSIKQKITLHPDALAGKELLKIAKKLLHVDTYEQRVEWEAQFKHWMDNYEQFVSERSFNQQTGEIWFTHKELRSAAWNLGKLILENHLFYYLNDSDVSRTNNFLEGGINSRLKQLLYFHRRCTIENKQKLIEFYLLKRSNYFKQVTFMLYIKIK